MSDLVNWLATIPSVSDCRAVVATIGGKRYEGAVYRDTNFNNEPRYYLLGNLPACYKRSGETAFVVDGEDWYIACYMPADRITAEYAPYHPYGPHFMLCRWQVPSGEPIDRYNYYRGEWRPYNRVPALVAATS